MRVARFVALCWATALSLQLVMSGSADLFSKVSNEDLVPAELSLPKVHTDCTGATLTAAPDAALPALTPAEAEGYAYFLGFKLGFATGIRNAGSDPSAYLSSTREQSAQLAAALRVPIPTLPVMGHAAEVLHDFEVFLQADPQCIASLMTSAYSAKAAAFYRFGASLAHVFYYRSVAPQLGPLFVAQLRVYGQEAGLPEQLWLPIEQDMSQLTTEQAHARASAVKGAVEQHLERAARRASQ